MTLLLAGSSVSAQFVISLPQTYGVPSPTPTPSLASSFIHSLPPTNHHLCFILFHFLFSPPLPLLLSLCLPSPSHNAAQPFSSERLADLLHGNCSHKSSPSARKTASDNEFLSTNLTAKFPFSLCVGLLYHRDNEQC